MWDYDSYVSIWLSICLCTAQYMLLGTDKREEEREGGDEERGKEEREEERKKTRRRRLKKIESKKNTRTLRRLEANERETCLWKE